MPLWSVLFLFGHCFPVHAGCSDSCSFVVLFYFYACIVCGFARPRTNDTMPSGMNVFNNKLIPAI